MSSTIEELRYVAKVLELDPIDLVEEALREKLDALYDEQDEGFQSVMTAWHDRREQESDEESEEGSTDPDFDGVFGDLARTAKELKESPITEDNVARSE